MHSKMPGGQARALSQYQHLPSMRSAPSRTITAPSKRPVQKISACQRSGFISRATAGKHGPDTPPAQRRRGVQKISAGSQEHARRKYQSARLLASSPRIRLKPNSGGVYKSYQSAARSTRTGNISQRSRFITRHEYASSPAAAGCTENISQQPGAARTGNISQRSRLFSQATGRLCRA